MARSRPSHWTISTEDGGFCNRAVSVVVAVLIGGIETLRLIGDTFKLEGPFWDAIGALNDNFGVLGYIIIGGLRPGLAGLGRDLPWFKRTRLHKGRFWPICDPGSC
ncbi:MAG: hypothetical protein ACLPVO_09945 [Desulfomonilaceae bacterium]